ncbi:MAG TPA: DUF2914 domain-containing protein [Bacteroidetes bacterium]|nr:DUF2914 domain-containing protein [Bacteroidota bacterium]
MKRIFLFTAVSLLFGSASALLAQDAGAGSLTVERMVIAENVVDREPEGDGTSFPAGTEKLYCFTHIKGAQEETTITHRWMMGDSVMAEVQLPVKSTSWRTWSSKNFVPGWAGEWKVQVLDGAGNVLKETSFVLQKEE